MFSSKVYFFFLLRLLLSYFRSFNFTFSLSFIIDSIWEEVNFESEVFSFLHGEFLLAHSNLTFFNTNSLSGRKCFTFTLWSSLLFNQMLPSCGKKNQNNEMVDSCVVRMTLCLSYTILINEIFLLVKGSTKIFFFLIWNILLY